MNILSYSGKNIAFKILLIEISKIKTIAGVS